MTHTTHVRNLLLSIVTVALVCLANGCLMGPGDGAACGSSYLGASSSVACIEFVDPGEPECNTSIMVVNHCTETLELGVYEIAAASSGWIPVDSDQTTLDGRLGGEAIVVELQR